MTVTECLQTYRHNVSIADSYMQSAFERLSDGSYKYGEQHRDFIVDAAFLKFFIAWETFLEGIFACFLMGEQTTSGTVVAKCVTPNNEDHAKKIMIGNNKYYDWTNHENVIQLSKLLLSSENPIEHAIFSIKRELSDLKTIRNAAAHLSTTTQGGLNGIASRLLGHEQHSMTPSKLILQNIPGTACTFWDDYKQKLDIAAENIAKGEV